MITKTEHYLGAVREHLILRRMSPSLVGQYLEEIAGHLRDTGADPVDEYGPPDRFAEELAQAARLVQRPWQAMAAIFLLGLALLLSLTLLSQKWDPAVISSGQLGDLLFGAGMTTVAMTLTVGRLRDSLLGLTPFASLEWRRLAVAAGVFVAVVFGFSAVVEWALDNQLFGVDSVPSWVAGLVLLVLQAPFWRMIIHAGRPEFSAESGLRASIWGRRIHVGAKQSKLRCSFWADDRMALFLAAGVAGGLAALIGVVESLPAGAISLYILGSYGLVWLRRRSVHRQP